MINYDEILESLALLSMTDDELDAYAATHSEPIDEWGEFEEDYASNAPCDFSGICIGTSCPYWGTCQGD